MVLIYSLLAVKKRTKTIESNLLAPANAIFIFPFMRIAISFRKWKKKQFDQQNSSSENVNQARTATLIDRILIVVHEQHKFSAALFLYDFISRAHIHTRKFQFE